MLMSNKLPKSGSMRLENTIDDNSIYRSALSYRTKNKANYNKTIKKTAPLSWQLSCTKAVTVISH